MTMVPQSGWARGSGILSRSKALHLSNHREAKEAFPKCEQSCIELLLFFIGLYLALDPSEARAG